MTTAARDVLDAIDRLPESDRVSLTAEILRRTIDRDLPPVEDEELIAAAEAVFLRLDAQETADAGH